MLKKIFTILFLSILFFSVMPNEAFCNDQQSSQECHHGIIVCHASCSATVDTQSSTNHFTSDTSSQYLSTFSFLYEGPSLDKVNRPPIYSS